MFNRLYNYKELRQHRQAILSYCIFKIREWGQADVFCKKVTKGWRYEDITKICFVLLLDSISSAYGAHHRTVEANEPDAASSGHESHKDHKPIKSSE